MWRDPHEQEVTAPVSLDAPWALVQRFNGLVRDSGSKAERRGVDYIIKQLAKPGVPHALHEPDLLISLPRRARLEVVAPEPRVLTAKTPSMSLSTDGRYKRGILSTCRPGRPARSPPSSPGSGWRRVVAAALCFPEGTRHPVRGRR